MEGLCGRGLALLTYVVRSRPHFPTETSTACRRLASLLVAFTATLTRPAIRVAQLRLASRMSDGILLAVLPGSALRFTARRLRLRLPKKRRTVHDARSPLGPLRCGTRSRGRLRLPCARSATPRRTRRRL